MKKNSYKVIDSKGRVYLTKELRDKLNVDIGDIVKVEFNKNNINIKKVELIEIDDKTPEAI
ncbi:AbrB/MazE/SpoVT family DNA-binding domain-containing protein [uncultured Tyzzerella sp.]|uniref:AbrB/MazE/SpoVT family DNA-binding domain-containing protein n=1 Tax=uncultured Tyzzerella sp. TaxID=2321398 RepID=UPI002942AC2B|nr:AbrB/MazE/SpoVT family DNA-binding domain-containing protein [uncultured Tyzzerella sp.]